MTFDEYAEQELWTLTECAKDLVRMGWNAQVTFGGAAIPEITDAMIEAGAQRLVRWDESSQWPDSWSAMDVAAAQQDAERVIRSALSVMGGGEG